MKAAVLHADDESMVIEELGEPDLGDHDVRVRVAGAAALLRTLSNSNSRIGVIGHCSGGRHTFLMTTELPIQAGVVCYGGMIVGEPVPQFSSMVPLVDRTPQVTCPILGLFGNDDNFPTQDRRLLRPAPRGRVTMCTHTNETLPVTGSAKSGGSWLRVTHGRVPFNPHGGSLPDGATQGSGHVREAVHQLQGLADERQVPGARTAPLTPGGFLFNAQGLTLIAD